VSFKIECLSGETSQAMSDKIFINYRREDSIGTAGRLRDRLAEAFGEENLFMDIDNIPAGVDFVADLNSQVAACRVFLAVIGPNWLDVKDESGVRRLDNPDDFVTIEIAAALARGDIRVIPVLVDNARMPKADKLPDPIKPLARRNAIEVRNSQFRRDAEALAARMREALGDKAASLPWWRFVLQRRKVMAAAAVAVLLIIGWGGYAYVQQQLEYGRIGFATKGAFQQLEASVELTQKANKLRADGKAYFDAGNYDRAIDYYSEAIRTEPMETDRALAVNDRGKAYAKKGDNDQAIADFTEAIRLDPNPFFHCGRFASPGGFECGEPFYNLGVAYEVKGDNDRAIAVYNKAIQLNPNYARAFCNRGNAKLRINDTSGNEDIAKAKQLDASVCR
jgi:tetratricopeptide (TPR) repeat protein